MEKNLTFILWKTSEPGIKTIYKMVYAGKKVIERKSLRYRISEKNWDSVSKRVTSKEKNHVLINSLLVSTENTFRFENSPVEAGSDKTCSLFFFENRLNSTFRDGTTKASTYKKYSTILQGFKSCALAAFGKPELPFAELRNPETIRELTLGLKKSRRKSRSKKEDHVVFNYLSVFKTYVDLWNMESGTQFPVNTAAFFRFINRKKPAKQATVLSDAQIRMMGEYIPKGKRNSYSETLAKSMFLFQYHAGGIRIQDCLFLTNKMFHNDRLTTTVKKTGGLINIPYCFGMVECLRPYHEDEYRKSVQNVRTGKLSLPAEVIMTLYRIGNFDFSSMDYASFMGFYNMVSSSPRYAEIMPDLGKVRDLLEKEIMDIFFSSLREKPEQFVFPQLDIQDFKGVRDNTAKFTPKHEYILHRARTRHNSALSRIGKSLGIENLTGHVPRHTLANHLMSEGFGLEKISHVLAHAETKTTKIYLKNSHGYTDTMDTLKEFRERKK
jgi:integrase